MNNETEAQVTGRGGISMLRGGSALSSSNVDAKGISMKLAVISPGAVIPAHLHVDFETMIYILEGTVRHEYGDGCKLVMENQAGDFLFIQPGVPHEVFNLSDTEPAVAVIARSASDEREQTIPYDRAAATGAAAEESAEES
ncbi:MAG: cupin domain-containing protein [Chloroflexota bacterium]|nr:cupin domain-containing protein [Chloroflexota bacterium]MDE2947782.1 cupin domain-containing protein [Chloroflexota bacterium]